MILVFANLFSAPCCCAGLASSGLDVTGAVAILNTGSWNTYPQIVLHHQKGSDSFTYNATGEFFHNPPRLNHYFLEDLLEFLDQPTEWFYDPEAKFLYLWPDNGENPVGRSVRGKVSTYAFNITDCQHVVFANMTFFATTLWAASLKQDNSFIDSLHLSTLNFSYPSYSKRMLRSIQPPEQTFISSEPLVFLPEDGEFAYAKFDESETWQGYFSDSNRRSGFGREGSPPVSSHTEYGHHSIYNCTWMYTDGSALIHTATRSRIVQ